MMLKPLRPKLFGLLMLAGVVLPGCDKIQSLVSPAPKSEGASSSSAPPTASASAATPTAQPAQPAQPAQSAPTTPPAPPVSVTTVLAQKRSLPISLQATGTVVPMASVEVRPQVSSVITKVHVAEGQFVRAGELLFTLDSRSDEANVAKLRAQMAKDEATLMDAQRQLARNQELLVKNFISQGAVDTSQASVNAQLAAIGADRAAVDAAKVALDYAQVKAPSSGRLGVVPVYVGSAVQANVTTLATLTQLDPVNVAFSVPQRYLGDLLSALESGRAAVSASLPANAGKSVGRLQFVDNAVDPSSGTIKVKARFDNRDRKLWPGAFVQTSLTLRTLDDAIVVPQAVIVESVRGSIVYVVEDGKVALRPVKVVAVEGEDAAVTGVKAGEKLVLDGRQNLRPGGAVIERTPGGAPKKAAP